MPSEDKARDVVYSMSLYESVIDPTRDNLDPDIFGKTGEKWKLKEPIRQAILGVARKLERYGEVKHVYLTGSILSFQWLPWSDIDLHLVMEFEDDDAYDLAVDFAKSANKNLDDTKHRLEVFVETPLEYTEVKYTGLYDVEKNVWVKPPYNISVEVTKYMDRFKSEVVSIDLDKAELIRDLVDVEFLTKLSASDGQDLDGMIRAKIAEVNSDVMVLVDKYITLKELRTKALSGDIDPEEVKKWGDRQSMPANVIWKLMERYAYQTLLRELKKIVEEGERKHPAQPIATKADVKKVADVVMGQSCGLGDGGRCPACEG